jgi:hypothetical protein
VHHDHRIPVMPAHLTAPDQAFPALVPQQQGAETVLTGLLPDAAALYGVLAEIEALGLDLLEVRKVGPWPHPGFA